MLLKYPVMNAFLAMAFFILLTSNAQLNKATEKPLQQPGGSAKSYCESETFRAKCWTDHVIVMQSALYGRMRIGRCVTSNLGYLGCQSDVLGIADSKCSAQQVCEIRIPDGDFDNTNTCFKELKVYFEANYTCLRVISEDQTCTLSVTASPSHISSLVVSRHDCGSEAHPWLIQADPGQQIVVSIMEFSIYSTGMTEDTTGAGSTSANAVCVSYGYVLEPRGNRNISICSGKHRATTIYESTSNLLQIVLWNRNTDHEKFILRFQAVGCADLRLLRDAWIRRTKNEIVVGCNSTSQTWHLRCQGNQWIGVIGNCTQRLHAAQTEARVAIPVVSFTSDMLIIVVAVISMTLCIIIIFVGVAYVRSWSTSRPILSPSTMDYTSVLALDGNAPAQPTEGLLSGSGGGVKRPSLGFPSCLSLDYTEVLQPTIPRPDQRDFGEDTAASSAYVSSARDRIGQVTFGAETKGGSRSEEYISGLS